MSKSLKSKLHELQNRGDSVLSAELSALLEATTETGPYSRRLLAHAAQMLREGSPPNYASAHDYLGASLEAHVEEQRGGGLELPSAVTASLTEKQATERAFRDVKDYQMTDSFEFEKAPMEMVRVFAMLLLNGGYTEEARRYLTEYNVVTANQSKERVDEMKTKQALRSLQAKYRKQGDLVRARALEEVIADLDEVQPEDSKAAACEKEAQSLDGDLKEKALNAAYMMRAAEELMKDPNADQAQAAKMLQAADDMMNKVRSESAPAAVKEDEQVDIEDEAAEGEDKPVLEVEPATEEEETAKDEAQAALASGNVKAARKHLAVASRLEKLRFTAALMRKGDMELAMAGLVEADADQEEAEKPAAKSEDELPADEKGGGYEPKVDPAGDAAPVEDTEEEAPSHDDDEKPIDKPVEEEKGDEDVDEKEVAQAIARTVRKALRKKDMKTVVAGLKDLDSLEKEVVAQIKCAEKELKDKALATEGYATWKEIRGLNLKTKKIVADAEGDDEESEKAAKGLDALGEDQKLDDTLESKPEEEGADEDKPSFDFEAEKEEEEEEPKEDEEADAMKYEVLQGLEDLKNLKIDRSALAFTFWDHEEDPFWTIQANGKPVAEVHLEDQSEPQDVKAFFCDQSKWPNVIAQSTEKVGLYDMLRGVKARFYAHGVTKTGLANSLRQEVEASMKDVRAEKLGVLRNDFVEAMAVAAEALNKGLMTGKSNPLKKAFVERLAALGFHNPALVVEEAFASSFRPWLDQVVADAGEYLEMPKEAFVHTKRMVSAASNMAANNAAVFASETLGQRMSRTSMPLTHVEDSEGAPAEIEASLRQMSAAEKNGNLKNRIKLSAR